MAHRDLPFVRGPLPGSLVRRVVTIGPGGSLPYDSDAWRDALIIVDRGAIELHDTAGRRWTFGHGSVLSLWELPLRFVGNRGPTTAVLVAICLARAHDKEEQQVLDDKVAVIYGPGSIGSTVARAFADAGAQVHLAGRTEPTLDAAADSIRAAGGEVRTRVVDALDPIAVREHADRVVADAGRIDICFNLISHGDVHGTALIDMDVEDFARPVESMIRSTFITAQATGRHMVQQGSGLILFFGGTGETPRGYRVGGTMVAFDAQETMRRQLATELGPHGVRAITIVTHGIPESGDPTEQGYADATLIGRAATYDDVGRVAVFAASDQARVMTAATLNISGGAVID
jgi:3-oxoacyl-[acyl-carrier protein] reductase